MTEDTTTNMGVGPSKEPSPATTNGQTTSGTYGEGGSHLPRIPKKKKFAVADASSSNEPRHGAPSEGGNSKGEDTSGGKATMAKDEAPKKKAAESPSPKASNDTETSINATATPGWQCHNCGVQNPNTKARCACKAWKGGKKKTASNGKSKPSHWGTRSNLSASNIISTGSLSARAATARAATKGSHTEKNIYPFVLHKGDLVRLSNE